MICWWAALQSRAARICSLTSKNCWEAPRCPRWHDSLYSRGSELRCWHHQRRTTAPTSGILLYRGRSRRHVVRLHICFITVLYTWRVPYQQSQMSCTHTWPSQVLLLLLWSLACWCDKGRRWCVDRRGSCFFTLIPAPPNNTQQRHFSFQVFTGSFFFFTNDSPQRVTSSYCLWWSPAAREGEQCNKTHSPSPLCLEVVLHPTSAALWSNIPRLAASLKTHLQLPTEEGNRSAKPFLSLPVRSFSPACQANCTKLRRKLQL